MQLIAGLTLAAALAALPAATRGSPIAGTWTASLHGQPCIKLTVEEQGGQLSGNIIFYLLMLENGSWKVKGDDAVALINPRLEGKTFVFQVPHAKKHGSKDPADQEIKTFRLYLKGHNRAVFRNAANGQDLVLRREAD